MVERTNNHGLQWDDIQEMVNWFQTIRPQVPSLQAAGPASATNVVAPHVVPPQVHAAPQPIPVSQQASTPTVPDVSAERTEPRSLSHHSIHTPVSVADNSNPRPVFTRPPAVFARQRVADTSGDWDSEEINNPPQAYTRGANYTQHSFATAVGANASDAPTLIPRLRDPFNNGFGRLGSGNQGHGNASDSSGFRRPQGRVGRNSSSQARGTSEFDDTNEKMKRVSKNSENEFILLPSSVPIYNSLSVLSQEAELQEQESEYLRKRGLIKSVLLYDKIAGPRIATNFRKAFGSDLLPGDFDCAKSINGRRLNNTAVKNIKEFTGFNSLFNFYQGCEYCFIVPAGWRHYLTDDPEVRREQENWWREYSEFRAEIRAKWQKDEAEKRKKEKAKSKGKRQAKGRKGKQRAGLSDEDSLSTDADLNLEAACCEECGGLFEIQDLEGHICRPRKRAADQSNRNVEERAQLQGASNTSTLCMSSTSISSDTEFGLNSDEEQTRDFERLFKRHVWPKAGAQKRERDAASASTMQAKKKETKDCSQVGFG